jgi:hypothetical protein
MTVQVIEGRVLFQESEVANEDRALGANIGVERDWTPTIVTLDDIRVCDCCAALRLSI